MKKIHAVVVIALVLFGALVFAAVTHSLRDGGGEETSLGEGMGSNVPRGAPKMELYHQSPVSVTDTIGSASAVISGTLLSVSDPTYNTSDGTRPTGEFDLEHGGERFIVYRVLEFAVEEVFAGSEILEGDRVLVILGAQDFDPYDFPVEFAVGDNGIVLLEPMSYYPEAESEPYVVNLKEQAISMSSSGTKYHAQRMSWWFRNDDGVVADLDPWGGEMTMQQVVAIAEDL